VLEKWFDAALGSDASTAITLASQNASHLRIRYPYTQRYNLRGEREHFDRVLQELAPDHPVLVMLGAAVRFFTTEGIDTLVYLNPINVEHLALLGVLDEAALQETVNVIERVVLESGGDFLDLHDLLPDRGFRDGPGHFAFEGEIDGPARLARALAPHIVPRAERPQPRQN
jgi:hypothetical protein